MPVSSTAIFASGIRWRLAAMAAARKISSTCCWVKVAYFFWASRTLASIFSKVSTFSTISKFVSMKLSHPLLFILC